MNETRFKLRPSENIRSVNYLSSQRFKINLHCSSFFFPFYLMSFFWFYSAHKVVNLSSKFRSLFNSCFSFSYKLPDNAFMSHRVSENWFRLIIFDWTKEINDNTFPLFWYLWSKVISWENTISTIQAICNM